MSGTARITGAAQQPPCALPQRGRFLRHAVARLAACALLLTAPAAFAQVLVVLGDESSGYQAVADELRQGLKDMRGGQLRVDTTLAQRLADSRELAKFELVVTVGLGAAHAVIARERDLPDPPRTLCVLIPRQSFEHLAADAPANGKLSALYIDQPLSRQLDLLRAALPDRRRVGVIFGPTSQELAPELSSAASAHALELSSARIDDASRLYGALQAVMPNSDVLLMLPDPVAANPDTVYGLLLTTYRAQLPVIGFSEGLSHAGALLSLYSTAHQQGRQAAQIAAEELARGGALPPPQYPKYFTVKVNESVARSLGLRVPTDATLLDALQSGHGAPGASEPAPAGGEAR